jgi:hypothetical protein
MNKTEERERLRGIVFKLLAKDFMWAAMNKSGAWYVYNSKPDIRHNQNSWIYRPSQKLDGPHFYYAINQPETKLDWTETLIER